MEIVEFIDLTQELWEDPRGFSFYPLKGRTEDPATYPTPFIWCPSPLVRYGETICIPAAGNGFILSTALATSGGSPTLETSRNDWYQGTVFSSAFLQEWPTLCAILAPNLYICWPGGKENRTPPKKPCRMF